MEAIPQSVPYLNQYKGRSIFVRCWKWIINIGIDENTSFFDRKRTRLLNGICVISFLSYFGNALGLVQHKMSEFESIAGLIVNLCMIFINSRKLYGFACHFYNVWNIFFFTFMSITAGGRDATEIYLVPSSVVAMLFFRKTSTITIYFIINFIFFGIAKYCHSFIAPVNVFPGQSNLFISNYILMFVILFLIILYFKSENAAQENLLERRNDTLNTEKQRSDDLLLNILPAETAEELKTTGSSRAKGFERVTVMFTDFENFTRVSETMSPQEIVNEIHYCYTEFDKIVTKHGVEKIKTIGDGYMAAGGLPVQNETNPIDTIKAAIEIRDFLEQEKIKRQKEGKVYFDARIGVHTGPIIAGVVGLKKFAYDIWGDTVNTASRLETGGETGKINISGATYELIKDKFNCTYRGKILAKNKGEIDMYFVDA